MENASLMHRCSSLSHVDAQEHREGVSIGPPAKSDICDDHAYGEGVSAHSSFEWDGSNVEYDNYSGESVTAKRKYRPRRSAKERRAQALRSHTRMACKMLQGLDVTAQHRGNTLSQVGRHLQDLLPQQSNRVTSNDDVCRHFLLDRCSWGDKCRFKHNCRSPTQPDIDRDLDDYHPCYGNGDGDDYHDYFGAGPHTKVDRSFDIMTFSEDSSDVSEVSTAHYGHVDPVNACHDSCRRVTLLLEEFHAIVADIDKAYHPYPTCGGEDYVLNPNAADITADHRYHVAPSLTGDSRYDDHVGDHSEVKAQDVNPNAAVSTADNCYHVAPSVTGDLRQDSEGHAAEHSTHTHCDTNDILEVIEVLIATEAPDARVAFDLLLGQLKEEVYQTMLEEGIVHELLSSFSISGSLHQNAELLGLHGSTHAAIRPASSCDSAASSRITENSLCTDIGNRQPFRNGIVESARDSDNHCPPCIIHSGDPRLPRSTAKLVAAVPEMRNLNKKIIRKSVGKQALMQAIEERRQDSRIG